MFGGSGEDELHGGSGSECLSGDDDLFVDQGLDTLVGGNNNDYLDGSNDGSTDFPLGDDGAGTFNQHKKAKRIDWEWVLYNEDTVYDLDRTEGYSIV